jgi:hypothetical protein
MRVHYPISERVSELTNDQLSPWTIAGSVVSIAVLAEVIRTLSNWGAIS